jgi:transposase-like protein
LLSGQDGLSKLIEVVLNQILEAQVTEALGADRHERTEERQGYRTGYRTRTLYTRVGPVTLQVPQTRDGGFSTDIFKRYQRSEQAFVLALMEMVVQGVSTRKVSAITEELCGASFSKSTVSALCSGLDARVRAFNERRLEGEYPFVLVDALFVKSRGLKGVMFIVSDDHSGLIQAIGKHFQGASWQRCQVHLMRNLLSHAAVKVRAEVAQAAKLVLQAPDMVEARRRLADFCERFCQDSCQGGGVPGSRLRGCDGRDDAAGEIP